MNPGKIKLLYFIFYLLFYSISNAEDKILSAPVINLENLEPSYENLESDKNDSTISSIKLKKRDTKKIIDKNLQYVNLIGLDKITAKTKSLKIKIGETAKFGLLEIKALKCGITNSNHTEKNSVAYLQVKDISENQNEKVFIFNGWTFSSNPSITPIDHDVYDIWLVSCQSA